MKCITPTPPTPHNPFLLHTTRPRSASLLTIRSSSSSRRREKVSDLYDSTPFPTIDAAKRVVLVRHGQSTWNEEGRIQGSSNFSVLTDKGEAQAEISRQMLIGDSFDVCFTSPLNRSRKTAEIIWGNRENEMVKEFELREIDLYSFQGLLKHEGKSKFGEAYREWQVNAANFSIDGHYPVRELWSRASSCWNKILEHGSRSVLVVAHNAVNQALIATALGLGPEYFRVLHQSNCGVSVLDFNPESPYVCLNRLNQTPSSPVGDGGSGGRKSSKRIILVCQGSTTQADFSNLDDQPLNILGTMQSHKIGELLLDVKVSCIVSSPKKACVETAMTISKVQEGADCLGVDSVPRYVEMKQLKDLHTENLLSQSNKEPDWLNKLEDEVVSNLWNQSGNAWQSLLTQVSDEVTVVVAEPAMNIALLRHCLNLTKEWTGSFHLDRGSISVIDFPDGVSGKGVIRCINYTAHLGRWLIPITKLEL